jgi:mono/diheme cytochrome c family protein
MMNRRLLLAGLIVLSGLGLGVRPTFASYESLSVLLPGDPLEGSRLFVGKGCIRCHAVYGVGGTRGPDLGRRVMNRPLLELAGDMWNHSPAMEHVFQEKRFPRPRFEPGEMASLLSFLYYLGSLDPPGDAVVGARLFGEKGCETCHSLGGKGGSVGPRLDKYSRYVSPIFLTTSLWNRGKPMARAMAQRSIPRPTFEGTDIADLMAYIRSAGGGTERVYIAPGKPKVGEALFTKKHCIECHSVRGHGGSVGPDLGVVLKGSLMRIAGAMWNHGPKMWMKMTERGIEVPAFSPEEMSDLISYLYYFQFIDPPGDAKRGLAVYKEKRCGTCHALRSVGGTVGPDLATVEKLDTPLDIITGMWNHAATMEEVMVGANVVWPVLEGGEMADLIGYLLQAREGASRPPAVKGSEPQAKRRREPGPNAVPR